MSMILSRLQSGKNPQVNTAENTDSNTGTSPIEISNADLFHAISDVKTCLNSLNNQYAELNMKVTSLLNQQQSTANEVKGINNQINNINGEVKHLEVELNYLKQKEISNDVIVMGVPLSIESADYVVNKLSEKYAFDVNNVLFASIRKPKGNSSTNKFVVIRFKASIAKSALMTSRYKMGPLDIHFNFVNTTHTNGINNNNHNSVLRIEDRLTPYNLDIMKDLNKLKKNKLIRNFVYKFGMIYINTNNKERVKIRTRDDVKE